MRSAHDSPHGSFLHLSSFYQSFQDGLLKVKSSGNFWALGPHFFLRSSGYGAKHRQKQSAMVINHSFLSVWPGDLPHEILIPEQQEEIPLTLAPLWEPQLTFGKCLVPLSIRWLAFFQTTQCWYLFFILVSTSPSYRRLCWASCSTIPIWDELTGLPFSHFSQGYAKPAEFLNH